MLQTIIESYFAHQFGEEIARMFKESFEDLSFLKELNAEELDTIDEFFDELKCAKILNKDTISELSEYHKAVKKAYKEAKENHF